MSTTNDEVAGAGAQRPPNIVYLHSHDTGRMISPYGAPVHTPHLQQLAEQGTVFRQAFAAGPTCSPSRAALLTGESPHQSGMLGLAHRGHSLTHPERHLASVLSAHGYDTVLAGLQHLAVTDAEIQAMGYRQVLGARHNAHTAAVEYLEHVGSTPFFLDVGFFETHRYSDRDGAFSPTGSKPDGRYVAVPSGLPDTPSIRDDVADFAAAVTTLDQKIGVVLEALRRTGQWDDTVIIVTTDHGIPFPHAKCTATDRGLGVMLILAGATGEHGAQGAVVDQLVSHLDVLPTVYELAGIPQPPWLQGVTLAPLLEDPEAPIRAEVFGEITYHGANYLPVRTVRTRRFRYIRRFPRGAGEEHRVLSSVDGGRSRHYFATTPGLDPQMPDEQLFDCLRDPGESVNLIDEPEYSKALDDLRARLDRWMVDTDDPLVTGVSSS
ncbi:sulfatase [Pseudactinotalea sp.]|uniref:sulfatase family protein n=1 Tax=Pseudactinotalea sp. TaxID=1926260 RepID=UPI003B3B8895